MSTFSEIDTEMLAQVTGGKFASGAKSKGQNDELLKTMLQQLTAAIAELKAHGNDKLQMMMQFVMQLHGKGGAPAKPEEAKKA
jgi:bacteriocin-like protein